MARVKKERMAFVEELATKFSVLLAQALTVAQLASVRARNRTETHKGVCHSHDFLDANEVMADAFEQVNGKEINLQDPDDVRDWNEAWDIAKRDEFCVPADHPVDDDLAWLEKMAATAIALSGKPGFKKRANQERLALVLARLRSDLAGFGPRPCCAACGEAYPAGTRAVIQKTGGKELKLMTCPSCRSTRVVPFIVVAG